MIYDLIFNTEQLLTHFLAVHGDLFYVMLGLIILAETGFFFAAFLPGDSLLFIAGIIAAHAQLNYALLTFIMIVAAILGNMLNFYTGRWIGKKAYAHHQIPFLDPASLDKTRVFFNQHGRSSIILARFVPFLRTLVPFVCGMSMFSAMPFFIYSTIGAFLWVFGMTSLGYYLGHWWFIREYISVIVIVAICIAIIPPISFIIKLRWK